MSTRRRFDLRRHREISNANFRAVLAALLMLAVLGEAAIAGPLENAAAAFQRGDYTTTRRIMQSLAAQGDPAAQWRLGSMYYFGLGAPMDWAEALGWYRKAAEQGHAAAQYDLGNMYYRGLGAPSENYGEAMKWYREAAKQGRVEAQNALANMYYHGLGVQPNYVLAYMWSNLAVANHQSRNEVAEKMSSAQIAEGQSMSERCLRSNYADCDPH
jgi:TPR repeat protein